MFERRLKILLLVLLAVTALLAMRAMQLQVFARGYWKDKATQSMKRFELLDTPRGRIVDLHGREVAVDAACIDACVDYRAIPEEPDPDWLRDRARARLRDRPEYRNGSRAQREKLLADEIDAVRRDLDAMWRTLAAVSGQSPDDIERTRQAIVHRVEMRRRYIWYRNYELAMKRFENRDPAPWYRNWLIDDAADAPQVDKFAVDVAEQFDPHVILPNIDSATYNRLGKQLDRYPGLVLRAGKHRFYPYGDVACHLIGHLTKVNKADLAADPHLGADDLRQYYPNDLIGRTGVEALFETTLRGARGRVERMAGEDAILDKVDPVPGDDVTLTIDIELQRELQGMFRRAKIRNFDGTTEEHEMHGAAVVIDIATGEVRALASYPVYDINQFDGLYPKLVADELNHPLMNRATQAQLEPGSTAKPMVGLGAITQGAIGVYEGIECTGYLVIHGKKYAVGRCWTASKFATRFGPEAVKHHPWPIPHKGTHGNPDGFLTFSDALERSCNVYFENLGDRLGIDGLSHWFDQFGLGRPTGIGIEESSGRLPSGFKGPKWGSFTTKWFGAIGQGYIAATPLQMANVAATIARDGVWVQPHLQSDQPLRDIERVDLHLDPTALSEAKSGMTRVVNSPSGTGTYLRRDDILIAGKTGTAQAAPFSTIERDADGTPRRDADGKVIRHRLQPNSKTHPNPDAPWYLGTGPDGDDLAHAWYIGFAPADHPQIAFAVLVEYGGSGGNAAAGIAKNVIEACVRHGYLSLSGPTEKP